MKEAERLAQAYADAVLLGAGNDEALAALLAHIRGGAVPEALDPEFLVGYLEEREDWRGREVLIERIRQAASAEVPMPDVVGYVERWGGACRDCADESGVCPSTGMPCGGARKAIEYVIRALQYGVTHGYISNPINDAALCGEAP
jgi:hypothetical protein